MSVYTLQAAAWGWGQAQPLAPGPDAVDWPPKHSQVRTAPKDETAQDLHILGVGRPLVKTSVK